MSETTKINDVMTLERVGKVGLICIDNPPVNASGQTVRQGLVDAVAAANADAGIEVIAIYAAGRTFVAGADIKEFGKTPLISLSRFGEMGYDLVIYPVSMLRVAMGAVTRALETLKVEGTVEPLLGGMQTREELYGLVGYTPGEAWETPV